MEYNQWIMLITITVALWVVYLFALLVFIPHAVMEVLNALGVREFNVAIAIIASYVLILMFWTASIGYILDGAKF